MKRNFLLGLTTTPRSDWREKIKEIENLQLTEVALFPTMLEIKEREELYKLLEKTCIKKIPHVHLRNDMEVWELDLLAKKYNTKLFNVHLEGFAELMDKAPQYLNQIYLENNYSSGEDYAEYLKKAAGICLDVSHYHDLWVTQKIPTLKNLPAQLKIYPIGCCHISAFREMPVPYNKWDLQHPLVNKNYSNHWMESLDQLDYVKKYLEYLPQIVSIELENSLEEQLKAKKYLEKMLEKEVTYAG